MTQEQMFEASFQRPSNYFMLPPPEQWAIDRKLGILDWVGGNLTDEQKSRFQNHYAKARASAS